MYTHVTRRYTYTYIYTYNESNGKDGLVKPRAYLLEFQPRLRHHDSEDLAYKTYCVYPS